MPPRPKSPTAPRPVTRVYPIGSLLASVGREAATPAAGTGDGGGFGNKPAPASDADSLRRAQQKLLDVLNVLPDDLDQGTSRTEIGFFGDKMIVTGSVDVQATVADLLTAMQGRQVVTVRAVLVQADEATVRQTTEIVDGVTLLKGEPDDLPTVAQVRYSGFEGRAQHAGGGRSVPYPANVTPVVATNAVGYNVTYGTIDTGLSLDVTPTLEPGGDGVLLDVDAQYVLIDGDDAGKGDDAPAASEPTPATRPANPYGGRSLYGRVETGRSDPAPAPLAMNRMAIKTSLRAPTGRWILVGSLGSSRDGQPTDTPPMHLLLRVDAK